jgi:hypothetical protein
MSESTGDKATPATSVIPEIPGVPASSDFRFGLGQQVIYKGECFKVVIRWMTDNGDRYRIISFPKGYATHHNIPASDLSELTSLDRCRLGVESLDWGKVEPMEGGSGYRVRGSTGIAEPSGTLETPGD